MNEGFRDLVRRTRDTGRMQRNLTRLRSEHETLSLEWSRIQQDPAYTEILIRRILGYVKKGEFEYQMVHPKENS